MLAFFYRDKCKTASMIHNYEDTWQKFKKYNTKINFWDGERNGKRPQGAFNLFLNT